MAESEPTHELHPELDAHREFPARYGRLLL